MPDHSTLERLIWQIAHKLRGLFRPPQYERAMLPMRALRRVDWVLVVSHRSKDCVGSEIKIYTPPSPLAEIDADAKLAEDANLRLLVEVTT